MVQLFFRWISTSAYLLAQQGNRYFMLRPVEINQASVGTLPGIYITDNANIKLVTDSGQQVILSAEPQQLEALQALFTELGFETSRSDYGTFYFKPVIEQKSNTSNWYSSRIAMDLSPVEDPLDSRMGLVSMPSETLSNTLVYAQQFDKEGILYRQYLYPTPADWDSLKNALNAIGKQVSIDLEGVIQVVIGDQHYLALMDYKVVSDEGSASEQLSFNWLEDQNNDGIHDYEVVFPNGDKQILYLLSVEGL
ncbi:MAG: hypothetical protein QM479_05355 [Pseudomonadota bacterium]